MWELSPAQINDDSLLMPAQTGYGLVGCIWLLVFSGQMEVIATPNHHVLGDDHEVDVSPALEYYHWTPL